MDPSMEEYETVKFGPTELYYEIPDLEPGTSVFAQVACANVVGLTAFSSPSEFWTKPAPPGPIPSLHCSSTSDSCTGWWTEPEKNGADINQYIFRFRAVSELAKEAEEKPSLPFWDGFPTSSTEQEFLRASVDDGYEIESRVTVTGCQPGETYRLCVVGANVAGPGPWHDWLEVTTPPVPPAGMEPARLVSIDYDEIVLKWEPPTKVGGAPITHFELKSVLRKYEQPEPDLSEEAWEQREAMVLPVEQRDHMFCGLGPSM